MCVQDPAVYGNAQPGLLSCSVDRNSRSNRSARQMRIQVAPHPARPRPKWATPWDDSADMGKRSVTMSRHEMSDESRGKAPHLAASPRNASVEDDLASEPVRPKARRAKPSQGSRPRATAAKRARRQGNKSSPFVPVATKLRRSELRQLLAVGAEHRLSLYMPLHAP